jgi:ferredoxin
MGSPFDVLRIDADADEEQLEQAYRDRVKEAHPDQGGSVEEFQTVRRAYETLKARTQANGSLGNGATADGTEASARTSAAAREQSWDAERDGSEAEAQDWSDDQSQDRDVHSAVTYLNYDVLSDFGWEIDDADLFEKADAAGLDAVDYGQFDVEPGQSLLEAAEDHDFEWPFACRGGACANCAIVLREGELSMPASHVLPEEMMERGIRLSCNGVPITDELEVVYNVKHMPELEDLLLPPDPFEHAYSDD